MIDDLAFRFAICPHRKPLFIVHGPDLHDTARAQPLTALLPQTIAHQPRDMTDENARMWLDEPSCQFTA